MIEYLKNTSLTFRIVSGLVLGILTGLFFGEEAVSLQIVADVWIGLMQMTVLPYVIISLIVGLGQLDSSVARQLAVRGGLLMLLFWGIALLVVTAMPMAFPAFQNAAFYSTHATEAASSFNPIDLYIPANPFHSMANAIIPAVVLFSSAIGIALIGMPGKGTLIGSLSTLLEALSRVTRFVVGLTPIGVFAIVSVVAGTMTLDEIARLQVYFVVYIMAALYLTFWVLPVLIATFTPFSYKDVFRHSKEALLTAFFTHNVFIVLPMLIESCQRLFKEYGLSSDETERLGEVIVPVTFNFPNTGKLLSLLFIPFVAGLSGNTMDLTAYPGFLIAGLASYFAKAQVAIPFLLDTQRISQDMFQLYFPTGIINGKFDTMVSAMNLMAFSLIGTAALTGHLRFKKRKLTLFLISSFLILALVVSGTRILLSVTIDTSYHQDEVILAMHLIEPSVDTVVYANRRDLPERHKPEYPHQTTVLEEIKSRGVLRAGYVPGRLPFTFTNDHGDLVGFDVELLNILAREMDVTLEFVPLSWGEMVEQLSTGEIDIVGSMPLSTQTLIKMDLSDPYLDGTTSVVVRDYRRKDFSEIERLLALRNLTVAFPGPLEHMKRDVERALPGVGITWKEIDRFEEFFEQEDESIDALVVEVEIGTAWTLLQPQYTVVIPETSLLNSPLSFAVRKGQHDFAALLGRWLRAKQAKGEVQRAYEYWILGEGAQDNGPRWSIKKDVLGWSKG